MVELKVCHVCGKPYTKEKRCDCILGQKPDEKVACRNATVFEDSEGNFAGWIDNEMGVVEWRE